MVDGLKLPPKKGFRSDFRELLSEGTGTLSCTRFLFFVWSLIVLGVWTFLSVKKGEVIPLPWEIVGILFTFGGVKVAQKYGEAK